MGSDETQSRTALWFLGTCLVLWLCLLGIRRLHREATEQTLRTMRETLRAVGMTPPVELAETPVLDLGPVLDEPDDGEAAEGMPPWAFGMTEDDMRAGIDPLTGRPLR